MRDAVQGGSISSATFKVKGDLADFPFHSVREGELRIALQVRTWSTPTCPAGRPQDGRPAVVSPWPAVQQASGEIEFDRLAHERCAVLQGRLWGYELRDVQGGIADLAAPQTMLTLQGQGRGPAVRPAALRAPGAAGPAGRRGAWSRSASPAPAS